MLADALHGSDTQLRRMLEDREQPYVLAVRSNHHLRFLDGRGLVQTDPATMADDLPPEAWAARVAGEGAEGLRSYDWARIALPWTRPDGCERFLLIRRSRREPERRAYYLVFCPAGTTLAELAGAAGLRWTIAECFQRAKDDLGLDHCEARSWHGWHRHMSLVMAAAAFLARLAADLRRATWESPDPLQDASGKRKESNAPGRLSRLAAAQRARDPTPPGPPRLQAARPSRLHPRLVAIATTPSGYRRGGTLQTSNLCATVVLDQTKERLMIAVGRGSPATTRVNLAKGLEAAGDRHPGSSLFGDQAAQPVQRLRSPRRGPQPWGARGADHHLADPARRARDEGRAVAES